MCQDINDTKNAMTKKEITSARAFNVNQGNDDKGQANNGKNGGNNVFEKSIHSTPHADLTAAAPPFLGTETCRPPPRRERAFCRAAFSISRSWIFFSRAAICGAFAASPPGARQSLSPRSQSVEIPKCRETLTRKSREGFDFPERYNATVCCVMSKLDANLRVETFSLSVFTRSRNFSKMSIFIVAIRQGILL